MKPTVGFPWSEYPTENSHLLRYPSVRGDSIIPSSSHGRPPAKEEERRNQNSFFPPLLLQQDMREQYSRQVLSINFTQQFKCAIPQASKLASLLMMQ